MFAGTQRKTLELPQEIDMKKLIRAVAVFLVLSIIQTPCASAGGRFDDNADGTITDSYMKLMWAVTDNQGDIGWADAKKWVKYSFGINSGKSYTNWRLPTLSELESLYVGKSGYSGYKADCGYSVKVVPEIQLSCFWVLSADTSMGTHMAFDFNLGSAFALTAGNTKGLRVLPVRNLE